MATLINKLFGSKSSGSAETKLGFKVCGTCTTGHTSSCTAADQEIIEQFGLARTDPLFDKKFARAKELVMGPAPGG